MGDVVERNVVTHSEFCRDPEKKKCSARNLSEPSACCNTYATHNSNKTLPSDSRVYWSGIRQETCIIIMYLGM